MKGGACVGLYSIVILELVDVMALHKGTQKQPLTIIAIYEAIGEMELECVMVAMDM
jgi:hypothetical protein